MLIQLATVGIGAVDHVIPLEEIKIFDALAEIATNIFNLGDQHIELKVIALCIK